MAVRGLRHLVMPIVKGRRARSLLGNLCRACSGCMASLHGSWTSLLHLGEAFKPQSSKSPSNINFL